MLNIMKICLVVFELLHADMEMNKHGATWTISQLFIVNAPKRINIAPPALFKP
jgi:hypothetical protein